MISDSNWAVLRTISTVVLMALVNSLFLAGCASVRGPARLARLQEAPAVELAIQSWESVVAIPLDSPLEVNLDSEGRIRGRFRSADEQTLVLEYDGGSRSVPRAEIRRVILDRGSHVRTGALWGLGIGSGIGVAVFADPDADLVPSAVILFSLGIGGIGAGIGALIGALSQDRNVIYELPVPGTTN